MERKPDVVKPQNIEVIKTVITPFVPKVIIDRDTGAKIYVYSLTQGNKKIDSKL